MFSAVACRNLTTGWISDPAKSGCLIAFVVPMLIVMVVVCVLFSVVGFVLLPHSGILAIVFGLLPLCFVGIFIWGFARSINRSRRINAGREAIL